MGAATHIEIETKFDAPNDFAIPDLTAVEGVCDVTEPVTQDLDAEYFDTADLSLLAADIGLRRRQGGDDAGWHVKISRSKGERVEVHRPLDGTRGRPPKELQDLVVAYSRGAPLNRVASLRTCRRLYRLLDGDGNPLADVADDAVEAEVPGRPQMSWREVEVELAGGDEVLLNGVGAGLRDHGATPAETSSKLARVLGDQLAPSPTVSAGASKRAGDVVAGYLREQTQALIDVDPAVRVDLEDAVHKMRVATRRLRSALATYRRLLDTDVTEPIREELKWLGGVLGSVRDAEVIRDHLRDAVDAQPARLVVGPVRQRILTTLSARHDAAHERAVRDMSSPRYTRLLAALDRLPDAVGGKRADKPAAKILTAEIRRTHRRMRRRLDDALAADGTEADARLHEARKSAKRVRYAAESASDVLGAKAEKLAAQMETAQDTLGTHQDTVLIRDVVQTLAREADAADEASFTYGRLHCAEQQRGDEARATFLAAVDAGWARRPGWLR